MNVCTRESVCRIHKECMFEFASESVYWCVFVCVFVHVHRIRCVWVLRNGHN